MSPTVLVTATNYSQYCAQGKAMLEAEGFTIVENPFGRPMTFDELKERVPFADAVVAGVDTWDETVFALAPKLKVISRFGVGVDNINLEHARDKGIFVTNAPGDNSNAVAELTIGLLLCALRNIPQLHNAVRAGVWDRFVGGECVGRTVGLLGFGNIARKVARKLSGFDMNVIAYDKYPDMQAAAALNVRMTDAQEVLTTADIVILLLPNLPETRGIMNAERFAAMKQGSIFINTARGALVDEAALYDAIVSGHLGAGAIDVYQVEPATADNPLFTLKQMVTTPHTAAETVETYDAIGKRTAQAIIDVFAGRKPNDLLW